MQRNSTHKYLGVASVVTSLLSSTNLIAQAQTIELDTFCSNYPQNSRCENFISNISSAATEPVVPNQLIRVQLNTAGPDNEIVFISLNRNEVEQVTELAAYRSQRLEGPPYQLLNGAFDAAVPIPIPLDLFEVYDFQDLRTEYVAFIPDSCRAQLPIAEDSGFQIPDCAIVGNETLLLSDEVDIRTGFFTLGYIDGDLIKAVIFRLEDHNSEFVDNLNIDSLCQRFPLNSRCRYWPISQAEE